LCRLDGGVRGTPAVMRSGGERKQKGFKIVSDFCEQKLSDEKLDGVCGHPLDAMVMRDNTAKPILETNEEFDEWMSQRPNSIKEMAKEFPFGTVWRIDNKDMVVIGWNESDAIIFSQLYMNRDNTLDIDKMFLPEERIYICAKHLRA